MAEEGKSLRRNIALRKVIESFTQTAQKRSSSTSLDSPSAKNPESPIGSANSVCKTHAEQRLDFFCLDCHEPVCSHCILLASHKEHSYLPMEEAHKAISGRIGTNIERLGSWEKELLGQAEVLEKAEKQLAKNQRRLCCLYFYITLYLNLSPSLSFYKGWRNT